MYEVTAGAGAGVDDVEEICMRANVGAAGNGSCITDCIGTGAGADAGACAGEMECCTGCAGARIGAGKGDMCSGGMDAGCAGAGAGIGAGMRAGGMDAG